jgi:signal peptidase I
MSQSLTKFMPGITAAVLGAFVAYGAAWYFNAVESNFSLILFIATVVTGIYWLLERLVFLPERNQAAALIESQAIERQAELAKMGITKTETHHQEMVASKGVVLQQPWWLDWTAGLFPVICIVFLLRSFLFEPFKIPTGSMIPTLHVGDLILVNKFTYGVRLPVINKKIIPVNDPQRGDVMVFRYPPNPNVDYIKRVIGLPGDEVSYLNKKLAINGKALSKDVLPDFLEEDTMRYSKQFEEAIESGKGASKTHKLLNDDSRPAMIPGVEDFPSKENCRYSVEGVVCKVPAGHYFMMGDNRDNSLDSRYWGFVPDQNVVGRAFYVWMNFGNLRRIGSFD